MSTSPDYRVMLTIGPHSWDVYSRDPADYGPVLPITSGWVLREDPLSTEEYATISVVLPDMAAAAGIIGGAPVEYVIESVFSTARFWSWWGVVAEVAQRPHRLGVLLTITCAGWSTTLADRQATTGGRFSEPADDRVGRWFTAAAEPVQLVSFPYEAVQAEATARTLDQVWPLLTQMLPGTYIKPQASGAGLGDGSGNRWLFGYDILPRTRHADLDPVTGDIVPIHTDLPGDVVTADGGWTWRRDTSPTVLALTAMDVVNDPVTGALIPSELVTFQIDATVAGQPPRATSIASDLLLITFTPEECYAVLADAAAHAIEVPGWTRDTYTLTIDALPGADPAADIPDALWLNWGDHVGNEIPAMRETVLIDGVAITRHPTHPRDWFAGRITSAEHTITPPAGPPGEPGRQTITFTLGAIPPPPDGAFYGRTRWETLTTDTPALTWATWAPALTWHELRLA